LIIVIRENFLKWPLRGPAICPKRQAKGKQPKWRPAPLECKKM